MASDSQSVFAFAVGISRESASGKVIDCYFPAPLRGPQGAVAEAIRAHFASGTSTVTAEVLRRFVPELAGDETAVADVHQLLLESDRPLVAVRLDADGAIASTAEAYLKLHLLSHRLALPNSLNLDGIFAHLPNVAWTNQGAIDPAELPQAQLRARLRGEHIEVVGVDKFPKMTN